MKKFFIVLIIVFICGILTADICFLKIKDSEVLVGKEFYEQYANTKLVFKDVFWNVLYERIKLLFVLSLLCFTPLKERIGVILVTLFSFVWGFFLMACIIELGVVGLIIGLASVLPHGIMYGAGIGTVLRQRKNRKYHLKNKNLMEIGVLFFLVLLFVTACVLESLIGVHFIPWVIRLSLI